MTRRRNAVSLRLLEQYRWIFFFNTFGTPSHERRHSFNRFDHGHRYCSSEQTQRHHHTMGYHHQSSHTHPPPLRVALARVVVCFRNCHFYYCAGNRFHWYKFSIDVASSQDEESHCNRRRRRIRPINYLFHTSDDDYEIEQ